MYKNKGNTEFSASHEHSVAIELKNLIFYELPCLLSYHQILLALFFCLLHYSLLNFIIIMNYLLIINKSLWIFLIV